MKHEIKNNMNKQDVLNACLDWFIHMLGYAIILIAVSIIFKKTIYIDNAMFGIWGLIAAIMIYLLNQTVKPVLIWLTLPITAMSLGLFYPFINYLVLKIVDFILGYHFNIYGIILPVIISLLISIMNVLMDVLVTNHLIERKR